MTSTARNSLGLFAFIAVVLGCGILIGIITPPGPWYATLAKPSFNPPNWIFGPVWSVLYVLIGIAGWRTFEREGDGKAMRLWFLQIALNFSWSPVFFGAHLVGAAFAVILALLVAIVAFIAMTWKSDRTAAYLFLPYAAWVAFATMLNGAIMRLN